MKLRLAEQALGSFGVKTKKCIVLWFEYDILKVEGKLLDILGVMLTLYSTPIEINHLIQNMT